MLLGYNFKPRLNSHAFGIVGSVVTMSLINEWMLAIEKPDWLACEQALRGALAVGREKEGEVATTSLEFEYLHQKSRCQMLIDGEDISNDVIILGTCFSMFVYIRARFCFALTGGNLTVQSTGSHRGIGGGIQIPGTWLQALLPFPAPPLERPGELATASLEFEFHLKFICACPSNELPDFRQSARSGNEQESNKHWKTRESTHQG